MLRGDDEWSLMLGTDDELSNDSQVGVVTMRVPLLW